MTRLRFESVGTIAPASEFQMSSHCQITCRRPTRALLALLVLLFAGCSHAPTPVAGNVADNSVERTTEKGPVKLLVRVTPKEPRLSDLVNLDVEVTAQQGVDVKPPEFGEAVEDFLVRDYTERPAASITSSTETVMTRRFRYQLEPVSSGRHLIRSIAIEFVDRRSTSPDQEDPVLIESDPIEIQVTSELGNRVPNLADLEPMLPPRPLASSSGWFWLTYPTLALLVIAGWYWNRRRQQQPIIQPRKRTPEEIAHAALSVLLAENLPKHGLVKEFYLRLTGIVRLYIEGTTGLHAPEQTTEEFLRAMRSHTAFPPGRSNRLAEFLEAADMVKYAGQQPGEDQIRVSIDLAREFVDMRSELADSSTATTGEA
jgi:hypothetical protein